MVGQSGRCGMRRARVAWRRAFLAAGLVLGLTLSPDSKLDVGAAPPAQAASLLAQADMRVSLAHDDWQAAPNEGFAYRVTVANAGDGAAEAHVETVLHPALGNVAVVAPGFTCARHFTASGPRAGTSVVCDSREPLGPGESATLTIRAHGATAGAYPILASATDDGAHAAMSHASATLQIAG